MRVVPGIILGAECKLLNLQITLRVDNQILICTLEHDFPRKQLRLEGESGGVVHPLLGFLMVFLVILGWQVTHEGLQVDVVDAGLLRVVFVFLSNLQSQLLSIGALFVVDDVETRHCLQLISQLWLLTLLLFLFDDNVCGLQA